MAPGQTAHIEYIAPDNSPWRAALGTVRRGLFRGSTSGPDFHHFPAISEAADHQGAWIKYKVPDGSFRSSKCRAHADPVSLVITFEFEHWRCGAEDGPSDYCSRELVFLDWDGYPWLAKVNPMETPGIPEFVLQRKEASQLQRAV